MCVFCRELQPQGPNEYFVNGTPGESWCRKRPKVVHKENRPGSCYAVLSHDEEGSVRSAQSVKSYSLCSSGRGAKTRPHRRRLSTEYSPGPPTASATNAPRSESAN